jgi:BlaI family transcriptional regulator, penicillinase repressor
MPKTPKPTDAELLILRALWTAGPSTVREVHDALAGSRTVTYTTTLKTLQVMTEKGLTIRDEHRGQHVYRPRHAEGDVQRRLVRDLLDRAFGGSTSKLIIQALASKPASAEDLREIRRLLNPRGAAAAKGKRS